MKFANGWQTFRFADRKSLLLLVVDVFATISYFLLGPRFYSRSGSGSRLQLPKSSAFLGLVPVRSRSFRVYCLLALSFEDLRRETGRRRAESRLAVGVAFSSSRSHFHSQKPTVNI